MTLVGPKTAKIVSSFLTAILFGFYLASFAHCVRWLLFEDEGWRVRKKINRALVTTTLVICFLSVVLFSTTATLDVFRPGITHIPAYEVVVIINNSNAFHLSILIIIDAVLIHRCWIVFSKSWFIICFPLALWCLCLVCAVISLYCDISLELPSTESTIRSGFTIQVCTLGSYGNWQLLGFYSFNIVVTIYTTAALVFKIWRAATNNEVGTNRLYRICRILTESGILYTLSSGFFLAYLIEDYIFSSQSIETIDSFFLLELLNFIALPVTTFMPGITFNLITIRVGEQRAKGQDTWVDSRDTGEALPPPELLNHPNTLTQQEVESTDLEQEGHERIDEGILGINGTELGEIMEVDRDPQERQ